MTPPRSATPALCTGYKTRFLYQCPGCWSYGLWAIPIGGGRSETDEGWIECECGERMTRIDLRKQEPSPFEARSVPQSEREVLDELTVARIIHEAEHGHRPPLLSCMTKHRRKAKRVMAALASPAHPDARLSGTEPEDAG